MEVKKEMSEGTGALVSIILTGMDISVPFSKWAHKVVTEFSRNGFPTVTEEAIRFNYNAWKRDFKSGYRDDNGEYHLFSPCGCNPLRFTATRLSKENEHWQKTYVS